MAKERIIFELTDVDYATLTDALNEAISAQTFYLNVCRDDTDDRPDCEIEDARELFIALQARLRGARE